MRIRSDRGVQDTRSFYERVSERYNAETFQDVQTARAFDRAFRTRTVLEMLERHAPPNSRIVDIGCGPAQYAEPLLEKGHSYLGIDIAEEMYRAVAAKLASNSKARFQSGSIEELPLESAQADVALVIGVLEYLSSDERPLAEVHRVLRPNGIAIVTFPNAWNPVHAIRAATRPIVAPIIRRLAPDSNAGQTVYASRIVHRIMFPSRVIAQAERLGFVLREARCHGYGLRLRDYKLTGTRIVRRLQREYLGAGLLPRMGSNFVACFQKS